MRRPSKLGSRWMQQLRPGLEAGFGACSLPACLSRFTAMAGSRLRPVARGRSEPCLMRRVHACRRAEAEPAADTPRKEGEEGEAPAAEAAPAPEPVPEEKQMSLEEYEAMMAEKKAALNRAAAAVKVGLSLALRSTYSALRRLAGTQSIACPFHWVPMLCPPPWLIPRGWHGPAVNCPLPLAVPLLSCAALPSRQVDMTEFKGMKKREEKVEEEELPFAAATKEAKEKAIKEKAKKEVVTIATNFKFENTDPMAMGGGRGGRGGRGFGRGRGDGEGRGRGGGRGGFAPREGGDAPPRGDRPPMRGRGVPMGGPGRGPAGGRGGGAGGGLRANIDDQAAFPSLGA